MKARLTNFLDKIFFTPQPLPPGSYNSVVEIEGKSNRLHLRIEQEGIGILVVNASTVLHLNQTATEIAYSLIKKMTPEQITVEMVKRYKVSQEVALQDIQDLEERIESLIKTPDLDPEIFLDMERVDPHSSETNIPFRLDCALTYQVESSANEVDTPVDRVDRSLDTKEWKQILSKSWEWGIPHVVFTGGEPTLRPDLVELVKFTQDLGQVTGLITDGLRLTQKEYLHELLEAGLDHLIIVLREDKESSWEAIRDVLPEDIHLTVHLTIIESNKDNVPALLDRLVQMGVTHISFSSPSKALAVDLSNASQLAAERGLSLVYDLPVPYSELNPVNIELEMDQSSIKGAGRSWLYVEPDGDVLPGQGYLHILGNFLSDSWINISTNRKIFLSK